MKRHSTQQFRSFIKGFGRDLIIAVAVVIILNVFIVQNQRVAGNSMAPTMRQGDMVIMNKWIYYVSEPEPGDIIGFKADNLDEQVVKRIIGVPGDIIDYKDNKLYLNNRPIITNNGDTLIRGDIKYPYIVPEGHYFVIGDNYNDSIDSRYRYIGPVPREAISGRIDFRLWPLGTDSLLK